MLSGDKAACQKHGITARTLERYRKRAESDRELSEAVQRFAAGAVTHHRVESAAAELSWHQARRQFLRAAYRRAEELLPEMAPADLAKLLDVSGGHDLTLGALGLTASPPPERPATAEDAGPGEGAGTGPGVH